MKCHNCGNNVPDESVFCSMCGAKLVKESAPETAEESAAEEAAEESVNTEAPEESAAEETVEERADTETAEEIAAEDAAPDGENSGAETDGAADPEDMRDDPSGEGNNDNPSGAENDNSGASQAGGSGGFVIKHCPYCGAVLMEGAKFCSNCGNSIVVYEQNFMRGKKQRKMPKPLIAVIIALAVVIAGAVYASGCHSIEGEWQIENSGDMFSSMLGGSYIEFDDGEAEYYSGFLQTGRYEYSYNRFTKLLTLKGGAKDGGNAIMNVKWIDKDTCVIPGLGMKLHRAEYIPYSDGDYDDDSIVQY